MKRGLASMTCMTNEFYWIKRSAVFSDTRNHVAMVQWFGRLLPGKTWSEIRLWVWIDLVPSALGLEMYRHSWKISIICIHSESHFTAIFSITTFQKKSKSHRRSICGFNVAKQQNAVTSNSGNNCAHSGKKRVFLVNWTEMRQILLLWILIYRSSALDLYEPV